MLDAIQGFYRPYAFYTTGLRQQMEACDRTRETDLSGTLH